MTHQPIPEASSRATDTFQVDLRGIVDLLSHHLYSSPRVYLRELVQNAVDAITARAELEPDCPHEIEIVPADVAPDGCLHIRDTGIGLDEASIRDVLATIGASSKRDELGFSRESFLGQFGIGLLSCFLVTDRIRLSTRRVGDESTWRWVGHADGTYAVSLVAPDDPEHRQQPGTEVVISPRRSADSEDPAAGLLGELSVRTLIEDYAAYLPVSISVTGADGPAQLAGRRFSWEDPALTGTDRQRVARGLAVELFGFEPLDVIELSDTVSGVRGMAFVPPAPAGSRAAHRVYARRMLVGDSVTGILPDWAFFVRAVIDGDRLDLTASRESLQDGEALGEVRDRLGASLRRWLSRTAATDPGRIRRFLAVHHLGAKAMAAEDDEMLEIVAELLTWETTRGQLSLADVAALPGGSVITYAESVEDFRQIAPLAQVLDLTVLNAGYAYDAAILRRWLARHPETDSRRLVPSELTARFDELTPAEATAYESLLEVAGEVLARAGVSPRVRRFAPAQMHAVLLVDRSARHERDRTEVLDSLGDGPWGQLLGAVAKPAGSPVFVLNAENLDVRRLADSRDRDLQRVVVEALYGHALVAGHHPLRAFDSALVARALPTLIERTLDAAAGAPGSPGADSGDGGWRR
ncbi:MAG: HSP90 family protein [Actinomycetales bacterium]|nr:MAG: HSP90 family protein [Actinomycetales bacterium]